MNIRAYQDADIEPFDGNINTLDKISVMIILNNIENNIDHPTLKLILFMSQVYLLSFF